MPKILITECKQEISSFNPVVSRYSDFVVLEGDAVLDAHRRLRGEVGGALSVFAARGGIEIVPTYSARARTSGGTLAAPDWRRISGEFLAALAAAPECDGAFFSLHGAMASEDEVDAEGFLLQESRRILGESIPIVVSLDLHGIVTERMLRHADAIVVYQTYPHVDFFSTGERAARLLLRILDGHAQPVTAMVEVPVLARGDEMITETGAIRPVILAAQAYERSPGGMSAGMFWGNPFTDVPDLRSNSIAVADGDAGHAAAAAREMADMFWAAHEQMRVPLTSLRDAAHTARAHFDEGRGGTVVLVDAADATSSGASGDSNAVLRALVDAGYGGRGLFPIVDAPAVRAALAAGVGNVVRTTVGGALDPARFKPLPVQARVRAISDGRFRSEHARDLWNAELTAVLELEDALHSAWNGHIVIATSRAVNLFDRSLFLAHGQDPRDFDCVVVKSPHCERHMFSDWAARYVNVDTPGATSADVRSLGHVRCRRPVWPLDPNVTFEPQVKIYRRR